MSISRHLANLVDGHGAGPDGYVRLAVDPSVWTSLAAGCAAGLHDLWALWADGGAMRMALSDSGRGLRAIVLLQTSAGQYPSVAAHHPPALRLERAMRDLYGVQPIGLPDPRPWLDHGRWPGRQSEARYEFLPAEGEGLHQIPVGPVHAGIIEPGHFRFSAQGETVARLEIRLGYLHKGTLALMRGKSPAAAARFAARLSGDTTVAHSVAFARAAEAASGTDAPPRADALRAVMTELERVANHIADCGAIANDAAFAFLLARCGWHREALLRAAAAAFGHRLMMDCVVPGGVVADIAPGGAEAILRALTALDIELPELLRVFDDYSSLVDRMVGTGVVAPALAERFAAGGFVGRASGRAFDVRRAPGYPPYDELVFEVPVLTDGDVDARVRIRFSEIGQSMRLLRVLLADLPGGAFNVPLPLASGEGIGWAEGFRGDIWHWLRLEGGQIAGVFMRDPSWLQWPLLESAIRGNIVADFPLCNKSFNCSYSGVDL
jgi:Ni,Fe-hydrogenase III large subunit